MKYERRQLLLRKHIDTFDFEIPVLLTADQLKALYLIIESMDITLDIDDMAIVYFEAIQEALDEIFGIIIDNIPADFDSRG